MKLARRKLIFVRFVRAFHYSPLTAELKAVALVTCLQHVAEMGEMVRQRTGNVFPAADPDPIA